MDSSKKPFFLIGHGRENRTNDNDNAVEDKKEQAPALDSRGGTTSNNNRTVLGPSSNNILGKKRGSETQRSIPPEEQKKIRAAALLDTVRSKADSQGKKSFDAKSVMSLNHPAKDTDTVWLAHSEVGLAANKKGTTIVGLHGSINKAKISNTKKSETVKDKKANQQDDRHEMVWSEFADKTNAKDAPNLRGFVVEKQIRLEQRDKFFVAMNDCVRALEELSMGTVAKTSRPVCRRENDRLSAMEQSISDSISFNHSRRLDFLDRMDDSNRKWQKQYTVVTENVLNGTSYQPNEEDDNPTPKASNTTLYGKDSDKTAHEKTKRASNGTAGKKFGLMDVCDFTPARKSVIPLLKASDTFRTASTNIDAAESAIESSAVGQMAALIRDIRLSMDAMESRMTKLEYDVEQRIMSNHNRRLDYQNRVEKSAKKAQSVFSSLLSGLFPSFG